MNRTTLRFSDGHEEIRDSVDPTATFIVVRTQDGRYHHFKATDDIDDDGNDVYVEEPPQ